MPIYEYQCDDCGFNFERLQKFSDAPITVCPECEGSVRKVIHPVGIVFKGSGFYVTDNRADAPDANSGSKGAESKKTEEDSKKEASGAEKKEETKSTENGETESKSD